ncbi:MAG: hypothetical protein KGY54_14640 [Oleiphilaceae bacterium]|nr:hypothetical protein [Oleiphilaceae bacterium]
MLDSVHHGGTGTGSPLMPKVDTVAALWGVGELYINGEKVDDHRVVHLMTNEAPLSPLSVEQALTIHFHGRDTMPDCLKEKSVDLGITAVQLVRRLDIPMTPSRLCRGKSLKDFAIKNGSRKSLKNLTCPRGWTQIA